MDDMPFSVEDRILCSDGACIGLVGANGLCKVCNKPYEGDLPLGEQRADEQDDEATASDDTGATNSEIHALKNEMEQVDQAGAGDEERICCTDDMCIGIIGENGVCGTCGKPL